MRRVINGEIPLQKVIGVLRELYKNHKYLTVNITVGKKRTIPLNSTSYAWYSQIARELQEHSKEEVMCLCKYHFGLPILRGDDPEMDQTIRKIIEPLPYENRLKAMVFFPVTSLMTIPQIKEYHKAMQRNFAGRVVLEYSGGENE